MSVSTYITDKIENLLAGLGTSRDKSAHTHYSVPRLTDQQLMSAYRSSWLTRKIVDLPPRDATREWRAWVAEADQISALEAEEDRLDVRAKVQQAMILARLFGGAAIYIGTGGEPDTELVPGHVHYLNVMSRRQLGAGDLEDDPISPGYGKPAWYEVQGSSQARIHPSRLVIMHGTQQPDPSLAQGWSDSVLVSLLDQIKQADGTSANIASLVYEAMVDVIRIPDFNQGMRDERYAAAVQNRFSVAAAMKGNNGLLLLDKEEGYERKEQNLTHLRDIMQMMIQLASGASDIPVTRLLGQSPAGMSATGDGDMRNYYDHISAVQRLDIEPAMHLLDECLIRSALGSRPPEVWFEWRPLWSLDESDRSRIGKEAADTINVLAQTMLFPDDQLSEAAANLLIERGALPGLETILKG